MPSNKPVIAVRTSEDIIKKMKYIANVNNRSVSKETELLIKNHIKQFEIYNGEINTNEND